MTSSNKTHLLSTIKDALDFRQKELSVLLERKNRLSIGDQKD